MKHTAATGFCDVYEMECFCAGRKQVCCSHMHPKLFPPGKYLYIREEHIIKFKMWDSTKSSVEMLKEI